MTGTLLAILVPFIQDHFSLRYTLVACVPLTIWAAYGLAPLAGKIIQRYGHARILRSASFLVTAMLGLLSLSIGVIPFIPFLGLLSLMGIGLMLIQVTANSYAVLLGDSAKRSGRLSSSLGSLAVGMLIGSIIGSTIYPTLPFAYGGLCCGWLVACLALNSLDLACGKKLRRELKESSAPDHRLWLILLMCFILVGLEISVESFLVRFIQLGAVADLPLEEAVQYTWMYYTGFIVSRLLGGWALPRFSNEKLLCVIAMIGFILSLVIVFAEGPLALYACLSLGACIAPLWPILFGLGLTGREKEHEKTSSWMMLSCAGTCLIAPLQGLLADSTDLKTSFILAPLTFAVLAIYGLSASLRSTSKKRLVSFRTTGPKRAKAIKLG